MDILLDIADKINSRLCILNGLTDAIATYDDRLSMAVLTTTFDIEEALKPILDTEARKALAKKISQE